MKKEYFEPEIDIVEFDTEDIITTSYQGGVNGDGSIDLPEISIKK